MRARRACPAQVNGRDGCFAHDARGGAHEQDAAANQPLGPLGSEPGYGFEPGEPFALPQPGEGFVFVPIAGTVCQDGSAFGIAVQRGGDELLIYLEGGGACFDDWTYGAGEQDCKTLVPSPTNYAGPRYTHGLLELRTRLAAASNFASFTLPVAIIPSWADPKPSASGQSVFVWLEAFLAGTASHAGP